VTFSLTQDYFLSKHLYALVEGALTITLYEERQIV